jgi:hypothetical protein
MNLSYAITCCNEYVEIQQLVEFLLKHKRSQDKITVLFDQTKQCKATEEYLRTHSVGEDFSWFSREFTGHFGDWKNLMNFYCTGDYIFNIDADEMPTVELIKALPDLINQDLDMIMVPRVNTVKGLTQDHIDKWRWNVNEKGWINFPDYQQRIYKNVSYIKWKNRVHEVLEGYKTFATIPSEVAQGGLVLLHPKTIEKQEKQNNYYNTL